MNLVVGGRKLYAMVSPEAHKHWSTQDYTTINLTTNFKFFRQYFRQGETP